jgi:hypothetical protein
MASGTSPPGGLFVRTAAAVLILLGVFMFVILLLDHGYTLQAALLGVGTAGAVAAQITHRLLGPGRSGAGGTGVTGGLGEALDAAEPGPGDAGG